MRRRHSSPTGLANLAFADARGFGLACAADGQKPVASWVPFDLNSPVTACPRPAFQLAITGGDAYVSAVRCENCLTTNSPWPRRPTRACNTSRV